MEIDAAILSKPVGDNHGPLISPKMYADFVLSSYQPVLEVLRRHHVDIIILRTYANARLLIPVLLENGLDCLWACEVNAKAMDYHSLRREFGKDLRLIGGIDLDVLHEGKEAIRREVEQKVPPLLEQGGYVPLADGCGRIFPWRIIFITGNCWKKLLFPESVSPDDVVGQQVFCAGDDSR